ncbi:MAG: folate-binding protein YgfZ [Gammaproteobacteria bacterium]|nr:folate-binding protein YgfZ [Gammaproteobacteria bacterium]MBP9729322.1 folate-binding protein YgfZ [Gammaproteobacteria bacterium]
MNPKTSGNIFDLNQAYGIIAVSGEKAAVFLQGQLSNDIYAIKHGSYQWSAYCNLKGRVRALLRVWPSENGYCVLLPRSILAQTLTVLRQYGRFSKITLEDKSADYLISGFVGSMPEERHRLTRIQLLILPDTNVPRFICVESNPFPTSNVGADRSEDPNAPQGDLAQWQALDIRAGIPEIVPQTIELFLPHPLGLIALKAISFNKGCFCGQEVIARMEYKSTPKRQLAYLQAASYEGPLPMPGMKIYADLHSTQTIGTVVNAAHETLEMLVEIQKDRMSIDVVYLEGAEGEQRVATLIRGFAPPSPALTPDC